MLRLKKSRVFTTLGQCRIYRSREVSTRSCHPDKLLKLRRNTPNQNRDLPIVQSMVLT